MKNLEQHEPEPELLRLGDYRRHFVWSGSGLGGWLHRITSQCSPTRCLHRAGIKLSNHIFSEEIVDHELCFCDMSACSVAVSYKPPMLVTRVRLPACAFFRKRCRVCDANVCHVVLPWLGHSVRRRPTTQHVARELLTSTPAAAVWKIMKE